MFSKELSHTIPISLVPLGFNESFISIPARSFDKRVAPVFFQEDYFENKVD